MVFLKKSFSKLLVVSILAPSLLACSGSDSSNVDPPEIEGNQAPVADINVLAIQGQLISLDGSGSSDPDDDAITYNWDLGDGVSKTQGRVLHSYADAGSYTVTLTIDDGELSAVASQTITVSESPPGFPKPFDADAQYINDIFVAPSPLGNDDTGDGSATSPLATISHALNLYKSQAGTRIRVQAGTYGAIDHVGNILGTALNPVAIIADGEVIIDAGGAGNGIQISDARYLVIQGLTIQNTGTHGLNIDDYGDYATPSRFVVLRDVHFRNIGSGGNNDCLKMSGVDDFYVTGSEFEDCNQGEAIDMVGCHQGIITGNYFHDVVANGVQTKGGSADVLIHGNRFEDIPGRAVNAGGSTESTYFRPLDANYESARIQIAANIFLRIGSAPVAFVGCDTCVFANNTIVDPVNYIALILEENTGLLAGHSGFFINNLIVFNTSALNDGSYVNVGPNTRPDTYTFGWNLWFAPDSAGFSELPYQSGLPPETNSVIQADPLLADVDNGDYRITGGSAAHGRGCDVPRGVPGDYHLAPFQDPPSIGALEVQ
jgi:PKD repeat protein